MTSGRGKTSDSYQSTNLKDSYRMAINLETYLCLIFQKNQEQQAHHSCTIRAVLSPIHLEFMAHLLQTVHALDPQLPHVPCALDWTGKRWKERITCTPVLSVIILVHSLEPQLSCTRTEIRSWKHARAAKARVVSLVYIYIYNLCVSNHKPFPGCAGFASSRSLVPSSCSIKELVRPYGPAGL